MAGEYVASSEAARIGMNHYSTFSKLATFCFLCSVVTFPLESLGFKIAYFRVSIPALFMYACAPFGFLSMRWDKPSSVIYATMLFYFLIITMVRWPPSHVVKPLGALTLISLAIFLKFNCLRQKDLLAALHAGIILNVICCILNYVVYYGDLGRSMGELLGSFYIGNPFVVRGGLLRLQGAFTEPAHHSIYCVFLLLVMLNFNYFSAGRLWFRLLMFGAVMSALILSLSMTGYILFLTVICTHFLFSHARLGFKCKVIGLGCVVVVLAWLHPDIRRASYGRIDRILDSFHGVSLESGNWDSSRTSVFLVAKEYVEDKGIKGFLVGEGYGNFEYWLVRRYAQLKTNFAIGQVANLTVVLFLATGIVGLTLFYLLLFILFRDLSWRDKTLWFAFLQMLFLGYGTIVSHMLWGMLAFFRIMVDTERLESERRWMAYHQSMELMESMDEDSMDVDSDDDPPSADQPFPPSPGRSGRV